MFNCFCLCEMNCLYTLEQKKVLSYCSDLDSAMTVQYHASISSVPRPSREQIDMAIDLIKKLNLKNFSVTNYPDPGTTELFCRNSLVWLGCQNLGSPLEFLFFLLCDKCDSTCISLFQSCSIFLFQFRERNMSSYLVTCLLSLVIGVGSRKA